MDFKNLNNIYLYIRGPTTSTTGHQTTQKCITQLTTGRRFPRKILQSMHPRCQLELPNLFLWCVTYHLLKTLHTSSMEWREAPLLWYLLECTDLSFKELFLRRVQVSYKVFLCRFRLRAEWRQGVRFVWVAVTKARLIPPTIRDATKLTLTHTHSSSNLSTTGQTDGEHRRRKLSPRNNRDDFRSTREMQTGTEPNRVQRSRDNDLIHRDKVDRFIVVYRPYKVKKQNQGRHLTVGNFQNVWDRG